MSDILANLSVSEVFIPHGYCYLWKPSLVWLNIISDSLIALAYYAIPLALVYFVRKRQDLPFSWIFLLFGLFIVACGTTHILEIWTLWQPHYWAAGVLKAITAIASLLTASELIPLVPKALALPNPAQLEQANQALHLQIQQREQIEADLRQTQNQLEQRVQERTLELVEANAQLQQQIRDRTQVEEELRQRNAILSVINESTPTPIFVKDRQGRIIYANPATLEVLGKPASEVIGYRDGEIYLSPEDAAEVMENDQRIMESGQTEVVEESPDGIRTFLGMKAPYRNEAGEVIGLIGVSNDITNRVQIERERMRVADERERLLHQEQAAREAAEQANRLKDEFLAVLSHELRTPLNPILGWAKLLKNGNLNPTKTVEALNTIERNAKLQSQLIEDLLDVSRILQGKLRLNVLPVRLAPTIAAALETVRLAAEAKNIQIQSVFDSDVEQVSGDADRLQQIFWNLLSNAVKFTPENGRIEVRLTQSDHYALIQVIDTGKGIAPDFLPYVFEHFRQEDGAITRKFGGLGLGLAIVRQLVELHGGMVFAESKGEGQGATFAVKLPILKQAIESVNDGNQGGSIASASLAGFKVLVVDDEPDSRDFVAFVLQQAGAEVVALSSARDVLHCIEQTQPDLLVSDIGMPEMDGYMLIEHVRTQSEYRDIQAIALTAYAGETNERQVLKAGFQKHLSKPVDPTELVTVAAQSIASARKATTVAQQLPCG